MKILMSLLLTAFLGHWQTDSNSLPAFSYDAPLPFSCTTPDGKTPQMRDDPWFLLGNYRITVFVHVDGIYELISGERSWARVNQGERVNSGVNDAFITIEEKTYKLAGKGSLAENPQVCKRIFGCGYAEWTYRIDGLEIVRTMRVHPSLTMDGGESAVLITTKVKNNGSSRKIRYDESVTANFRHAQFQRYNNSPVWFEKHAIVSGDCARVDFTAKADNPLDIPLREELSTIDAYAPSLYVVGTGADADETGKLSLSQTFTMKSGATHSTASTVGFMFDADFQKIASTHQKMLAGSAADWLKVLPLFEQEPDKELARELTWHAYNLEAMATWSAYYQETKIPQGTVYDYYWGQHASARDNFQHCLAPIYYHPELAKSILRYMAMRTTETGEVRLIETGYGNADPSVYSTSDQQLFYFYAVSEYLRVTGDMGFLDDTVRYYPKSNEGTMLEVTERCFDYLRNFVGTGPHNLIRLLNSDWLDNVYALYEVRYNEVIYGSESHMNSAMALAILPNLIRQLKAYDGKQKAKARRLAQSMQIYYDSQLKAMMADLGDRTYSRRMYYGKMTIGDDYMCLEPQAYLLLAEDFPVERKKALYQEMVNRIYKDEALGACQSEKPVEGYDMLPPGARDNGGFWYSLNGPAICGIATFDKQEAMKRLRQMSFANYAKCFPAYWSSYWSASDNICPAICGPLEGLPDQTWDYYEIPVYCAHPHAWMLYCYYKINEPVHPRAIAMWDFSWLERRWTGAGFEDWDKTLDEFVERGYNAVRIEAYPQLVAADAEASWTLEEVWSVQDWGAPDKITVQVQPALNEFIRKCRERDVKVALSSWFRRDTTHREMLIKTPEDLANIWIATIRSVEKAGLLDNILYVDLCNEWPGDTWAPYFHEQHPDVAWGQWYAEASIEWMQRAIAKVREAYPDIPLLFSIDCQDTDKMRHADLNCMDLMEHHLWMAGQNGGEFNVKVGYRFDKFSPESYKNLVANGKKTYLAGKEYWDGLLTNQIKTVGTTCNELGLPLITTECWAVIDYKDWPGLDWDWVKELNALGVTTAADTGQWVAIATSNFCSPQFVGMWRDVEWHKRLTSIIRNSKIDDRLLKSDRAQKLLRRL